MVWGFALRECLILSQAFSVLVMVLLRRSRSFKYLHNDRRDTLSNHAKSSCCALREVQVPTLNIRTAVHDSEVYTFLTTAHPNPCPQGEGAVCRNHSVFIKEQAVCHAPTMEPVSVVRGNEAMRLRDGSWCRHRDRAFLFRNHCTQKTKRCPNNEQ